MSARQTDAGEFNPNKLSLTRVARYERTIRAPIERVWENVLDWEHLPHLHAASFHHIELDDAGNWGWRTWSDPEHGSHVELYVASDSRYVARSYFGGVQATEIWTTLKPEGDNTGIDVEFFFPDVAETDRENIGEMMLALYARLWDEDESMMRERHRRLNEQRDTARSVNLGDRRTLLLRLDNGENITFQVKKREYRLRLQGEELIAHATICPHVLGPLGDADIVDGRISCPWHGYQFDLQTGKCLSPADASCSLPANASLTEIDGEIIATAD